MSPRVDFRSIAIQAITILLVAAFFVPGTSGASARSESLDVQSATSSPGNSELPSYLNQQATEDQNVDLRFEQIGIQDRLSVSSIQALAQDQTGYLWIGTVAGLNRYDGYQVTLQEVNPGEANEIAGEDISSLNPDSLDNLWIGTDFGLERLHLPSGEITHFRHLPEDNKSLIPGRINALLEDRVGDMWIGSDEGLSRFDPQSETFTRYLFANRIFDLYEDEEDQLWIASWLGMLSWNPDQERFTVYQHKPSDNQSLSTNYVTSIDGDGQGNLWVGTADGLNLFDPATGISRIYWHDIKEVRSLSDNNVTDVLHDSQGRTWIGTTNGLNLYDPPSNGFLQFKQEVSNPYGLSDNIITRLFEDRTGVIWIGTLKGGVNKFSDFHNRFQLFSPSPGEEQDAGQAVIRESLQATIITALQFDQQGDLWIGSALNGLYHYSHLTGLIEQYLPNPDQPDSLSGSWVNDIFLDHEGQLWVTTNQGLNSFDPGTKTFTHFQAFSRRSVKTIDQDPQGDLWAGTSGGLFRVSPQDGKLLFKKVDFVSQETDINQNYYTEADRLENDNQQSDEPNINQIFLDSGGRLWIATDGGLFLRQPGEETFTHFSADPGAPGSLEGHLAFSIYEDHGGNVWIGTIFGGLNRYDPSTSSFVSYTEQDGLPGEWVACIQEDGQGNLWLGTNRGLSQFDPVTENFHNFDSQDGIQRGEFYSCTREPGGRLYFGGFQGINAFYPDEIRLNEETPAVVITQINLYNQPQAVSLQPNQPLQLNYQQNFISFDYAALDYHAPEKIQYAYMLEGLDQDWVQVGTRRHAEYPGLAPGDYTFRVKATNNDRVWNEEGAAVEISIQPPFWGTAWFQGLVLLLLVGAAYAGYQLRVRSLQTRSRELEAEVAARTSELRERTREAEQRQAEIEALYRADAELYRYLHLEHVLHALLDTAVEILAADKALLVVWDDSHTSLVVNTFIGYQEGTIRDLELTEGTGQISQVVRSGESTKVETRDGETTEARLEAEGIQTSILVPIKIELEIFGVFSVDYLQPHPVTVQEMRLVEALAQRTALAIENARLYEQAQALAAVEERNRLARDLHDSVTQSLFGASMFADTAEHQLSAGQVPEALESISKMRSSTQSALGEMRLMIYELRPPILEKEGLAAALISRLDTVEQRTGIQTHVDIDEIEGLAPDQEQQVYSIAIEALNNILKHAEAEKITVTLNQAGPKVTLEIADDGYGFDPGSRREGGLGLIGMEERAAQLGAHLEIDSQPGRGTRLMLKMEITP